MNGQAGTMYTSKETSDPRRGEAILGEMDGIVDIIGYYLKYLHDNYGRNKVAVNKEKGQAMSKKMSSYTVLSPKSTVCPHQ